MFKLKFLANDIVTDSSKWMLTRAIMGKTRIMRYFVVYLILETWRLTIKFTQKNSSNLKENYDTKGIKGSH